MIWLNERRACVINEKISYHIYESCIGFALRDLNNKYLFIRTCGHCCRADAAVGGYCCRCKRTSEHICFLCRESNRE